MASSGFSERTCSQEKEEERNKVGHPWVLWPLYLYTGVQTWSHIYTVEAETQRQAEAMRQTETETD